MSTSPWREHEINSALDKFSLIQNYSILRLENNWGKNSSKLGGTSLLRLESPRRDGVTLEI